MPVVVLPLSDDKLDNIVMYAFHMPDKMSLS